MRLAVGELHALVLAQAVEDGDVAVVRSVEYEVVDVFDRLEFFRWLVLTVDRRDRNDRLDRKTVVQFDIGIVRIPAQSIERSRMSNRLAAARMADQGELIEVDFALE